ncbi:5-formyltetrahydrofolate cyclo-ligase [Chryseobacterium culicis]|uniref:5-formyltetrahydrofolate cyclo-ligase n=1 Tax=Chryseobacterium culicis TaxID=680127 RepID=A0A2S9CSV6_CHRCI|nr:5-formyltetrahydrofolate cyclo-ligase [Chryseobacterium culicis]PRB83578.1 5-formyltetrahydrofolate cyclo-ligase [Chryseobacterium culicis]PRB89820.1 5-formyltetrahydrofolate cyclo-ligase [Chryseobacterium culicis]
MLKAELRKKYTQKRKALSPDEAFLLSENIFENFIHYFNPKESEKVHVFVPIPVRKEIDTQIFIHYFLAHNIRVYVPKIVGDQLINIEVFEETVFEINNWGISEPVSNEDSGENAFDYVITPLLYCDQKGNRVGYGKGFYDGLFQNVSAETKKIGVNYFDPDEYVDDVWENDISLDYLVTPTKVLSFLSGLE